MRKVENSLRMLAVVLLILVMACGLTAQDPLPRGSAGVDFTIVDLKALGEKPIGIGGSFSYFLHPNVAADTSVAYYPANPSGNFGETVTLFGAKIGVRNENFGVFAKARPGVIHLGGSFFDLRLDSKTYFAFDTGVVLEYYPRRSVYLRMEVSDLAIPFHGATYRISVPPAILGTTHNLQTAFGIGVRF